MMRRGVILIACMAMTLLSSGQQHQYLIRYNLADETVNYFRIGKKGDTLPVTVVNLSKAKQVNLKLENATNGYSTRIIYHESELREDSVQVPGFGADLMGKLGGGILKSTIPDTKSERENDFEALFLNAEQKNATRAFSSQYQAYAAAYSAWKKAILFDEECKLLWQDLVDLRYNTRFPAVKIKETARNRTAAIFPDIAGNSATVILLSSAPDTRAQETTMKNNYAAMQKGYAGFRALDLSWPAGDSFMRIAERGMEQLNNYRAEDPGVDNDKLRKRIAALYHQITTDNYSQLAPLSINRKTQSAEIVFQPVIDPFDSALARSLRIDTFARNLPVYKKDPLRFRNTVGFSFMTFAENKWNYFIKPDSTIGRASGDQFRPYVVTFLHFYSPRSKGFRWGGSFGAGFAIGGDNTNRWNLMLGLSTFLGKNDPLCISAGVAGAQVDKLVGVNAGDKVSLPEFKLKDYYKSVYRLGYYISLTFNTAALNTRD